MSDPDKRLAHDGARIAGVASDALQGATDSVIFDARILRSVLGARTNVDICRTQGHALELIEVLKFNRQAALAGSDLRAVMTVSTDPRCAADTRILNGAGEQVREIQCKSYASAARTLKALAGEKYRGMGRLGPSDQTDAIGDLLDATRARPAESLGRSGYDDVAENFMPDGVKHDDVSSGGTSRVEAERAATRPDAAARRYVTTQAARAIGSAALKGGAAAGAFGASIAGTGNLRAWRRGDKTPAQVMVDTLSDTARAGAAGGTIAGGAQGIAIVARQRGLHAFAKSPGPGALAATGLQLSGCMRRYMTDLDFDRHQLLEECAGVLVSSSLSLFCVVASQVLIPVPILGGVVGAVVGQFASGLILDAGLSAPRPRERRGGVGASRRDRGVERGGFGGSQRLPGADRQLLRPMAGACRTAPVIGSG